MSEIKAMSKELTEFKKLIREAIADYMSSEGCSCCEARSHKEHKERIAKLLNVKRYSDGSGYDFTKFQTKVK
jgi:hypothetical protein